jgi:3-oxoacyl-[acyl-carrier protein] reductase
MNRVVLVTGGSSGIGRAVAEHFTEAGDNVVITGRHADSLAETAAAIGARAIRCDGSEPADVASLAQQLVDRVDVLVNMAGRNTDFDRTLDDDASLEDIAAAWHANLDANLLSTVLTTTGLLPAMPTGASIINVSSIGAEYASTSYGAAKAAVAAWTAGLSAKVGPRGITANAIAPGYIANTSYFRGQLSDERRASLINATHDKRAGLPEDIAATARFLASAGARHITGQTIHVNGGAHTTR